MAQFGMIVEIFVGEEQNHIPTKGETP